MIVIAHCSEKKIPPYQFFHRYGCRENTQKVLTEGWAQISKVNVLPFTNTNPFEV